MFKCSDHALNFRSKPSNKGNHRVNATSWSKLLFSKLIRFWINSELLNYFQWAGVVFMMFEMFGCMKFMIWFNSNTPLKKKATNLQTRNHSISLPKYHLNFHTTNIFFSISFPGKLSPLWAITCQLMCHPRLSAITLYSPRRKKRKCLFF